MNTTVDMMESLERSYLDIEIEAVCDLKTKNMELEELHSLIKQKEAEIRLVKGRVAKASFIKAILDAEDFTEDEGIRHLNHFKLRPFHGEVFESAESPIVSSVTIPVTAPAPAPAPAPVVVRPVHKVLQAGGTSTNLLKEESVSKPKAQEGAIKKSRGTEKLPNIIARIQDHFRGKGPFSIPDVITELNLQSEWTHAEDLASYIFVKMNTSKAFKSAGRKDGKKVLIDDNNNYYGETAETTKPTSPPKTVKEPRLVKPPKPVDTSDDTIPSLGGFDSDLVSKLPLRTQLAFVMLDSSEPMGAVDIIHKYNLLGWEIKSDDPRRYIYMTLHAEKKLFSGDSGSYTLIATLDQVLADALGRRSRIPGASEAVAEICKEFLARNPDAQLEALPQEKEEVTEVEDTVDISKTPGDEDNDGVVMNPFDI